MPSVHIVGAGPGDPDLLTVKALRLMQQADVVVYDRLVSDEILACIPAAIERICVGKQPRNHPVPQKEINALLVELGRTGRRVVRLKGGDPLIFGRGGEEAEALARHGIRYEIVPGITAASGCTTAAGIPLTHRGLATGVRFVTGHCREGRPLDLDWRSLADPDTTLVVYMARANVAEIAHGLIAQGMPADLPTAVISDGTTPRQKVMLSSLRTLPGDIAAADLDGPVLLVIGRVASLCTVTGDAGADAVQPVEDERSVAVS